MFSLVVPTVRGIEALEPLFINSSELAELIIVDSNYNPITKDELAAKEHNFKNLLYVKPKWRVRQYPTDMMSALNTGIAFSDEEWIMKVDDCTEFRPNFFELAKESIKNAVEHNGTIFAIRPVEIEPWAGDRRWESPIKSPNRYIRLPSYSVQRDGRELMTVGQIITHITTLYELNGWDERFDEGSAWNDNDMFYRLYSGGYPILLDRELMIFRYFHDSTNCGANNPNREKGRDIFKKIWSARDVPDAEAFEITIGVERYEMSKLGAMLPPRHRAPNILNLRVLHNTLYPHRGKFTL